MNEPKPFLSIVTPTLGRFSEYWLESLLSIEGDVEFILAYPPHSDTLTINDLRLKVIISDFIGEVMQRAAGLRHAKGKYVLALDDDDYVHPNIVELAKDYFDKYPGSWLFRLQKHGIDYKNMQDIRAPWKPVKKVEKMKLLEIPIAPLRKRFEPMALWPQYRRKDHHGIHSENFVDRIWRNDLVQPAVDDFFDCLKIFGQVRYIPPKNSYGFDRVMSLFLQAKYFEPGIKIGHWIKDSEAQIRKVHMPNELKPARFHFLSHLVLVKKFPRYGYLWNLFFETFWDIPRKIGKALKIRQRQNHKLGKTIKMR